MKKVYNSILKDIWINNGIIMKFLNLIIIIILIFLSSCSQTEYQKRERLENKMIGKTWRQLEKEKNLIPVGEGGSITPGKEFLELIFHYFQPLTIDEARKLVVYAAETFLDNLNSVEQLIELLGKPYPKDWIEIRIHISNPDYSKIQPHDICVVELRRHKINYYIKDNTFEVIKEESLDEALDKLKNN